MLQWAAAAGDIDLVYLDASGFSLWSPASYSYYFMGEQKRLEQPPRQGRRLSILGLLQPLVCFVYGLVVGSFTSARYIQIMDQQAQQAAAEMARTGRIRVVVQDNSSVHTSRAVQQKRPEWEAQGLICFISAQILLRDESH